MQVLFIQLGEAGLFDSLYLFEVLAEKEVKLLQINFSLTALLLLSLSVLSFIF